MENTVIVTNEHSIRRIIQDVIKDELKSFEEKLNETKADSDRILSREEAIAYLNISSSTLWRWTKDRKVESHGIGAKVFYKLQDVKNALIKTN